MSGSSINKVLALPARPRSSVTWMHFRPTALQQCANVPTSLYSL